MKIRPMLRNGSALALALLLIQPALAQTANVSGFGPAYQGGGAAPNITGTGCLTGVSTVIQKGDGSNGCAPAVQGTDYAPATSGTAIQKGNGAGGFSSAASGTDYQPPTSAASTSQQFVKSIATNGTTTEAQPAVSDLSGLGTGVGTALGVNVGSAGAPVLFNGAGGTPTSETLTNATGLPIAGITGLGTGVGTALGTAVSGTGAICLVTGSACGGGSPVSVTSLNPGLVVSPSPGTGTFTLDLEHIANTQSGTTYAPADCSALAGKTTLLTAGSAVALTMPNVSQTGCGAHFGGILQSQTQAVTVTVTAPSTINGLSSIVIPAGQGLALEDADGLNYTAIGRTDLGSMATQAANAVAITGGTINGAAIGGSTPAAVAATTISATGKVSTVASATGAAGLNIPHGVAPTSPVNGDCWTTTAGLFCQINGSTVGPFGTGAGGGNVNAGGTLTSNAIVLGAGSQNVAVVGSLGTTTTLLHGNAAGAPTFGAVSLTADVSNVLPVANGGTNLASYAVGDVLYASGTTTVGKLADVATGQVLHSGGVNTAPAYSAIVTGDLPGSGATTVSGQTCTLGASCHIIQLLSGGSSYTQNTTSFSWLNGGENAPNSTEANREELAPASVTLGNVNSQGGFYCHAGTAPPAGQTFTITLRKNEADTTVVCVVDSTGAGSDTTHNVSYVAGDRWGLHITSSATTGSSGLQWGITVQQ